MLTFDVITLFPKLIDAHLTQLPFKKAIQNELLAVNVHDLRQFAVDKRGTVDDKPYGGGAGMLLLIKPLFDALQSVYSHQSIKEITGDDIDGGSTMDTSTSADNKKKKIIVLSARGKQYTQQVAHELQKLDQLTLVCGRYEGIDARISELASVAPNLPEIELISIGSYILSGGELPALIVMESITRLIPGVLEKPEALEFESFADSVTQLEHPQYTRPENFMGLTVPEILLSGNHEQIAHWKKENSKK